MRDPRQLRVGQRTVLERQELLPLGIDAEARHAIWEHIRLLRARGTTVMVASNYLDEVQALCDIAAVLHEGRLAAYEAPESLVAQAGRCLDLDCAADATAAITGLVQDIDDDGYFTEKNNRWVGNTYHLPDRSGAYFDWSNDLVTQAAWKRFGQDSGA